MDGGDVLRLIHLLSCPQAGPGSLPHVGLPGTRPVYPWRSNSHGIREQICSGKVGPSVGAVSEGQGWRTGCLLRLKRVQVQHES